MPSRRYARRTIYQTKAAALCKGCFHHDALGPIKAMDDARRDLPPSLLCVVLLGALDVFSMTCIVNMPGFAAESIMFCKDPWSSVSLLSAFMSLELFRSNAF